MKKIISLMLTLRIMISVIPNVEVSAADSETTVPAVQYSIDGSGVLTIYNYNVGKMPDYTSYNEPPWENSKEYIKKIVIKSGGLTSIGNNAFSGCTNLTTVTIPSDIKSIGNNAFRGCTSLTSVKSVSATTIGESAFYGCESLTTATFPAITSIGSSAFRGCTKLSYFKIPKSVTSVGAYAFYNCDLKTAGPIGGGYDLEFGWTEEIPMNAFAYCTSLESVNLPNTITNIGYYAFKGCTLLNKISLKNKSINVSADAFKDTGFKTAGPIGGGYDLEFSWTETIPNYAFGAASSLTSIVLPNTVTNIGRGAFSDCISLTDINLPEGITTIGDSAFLGCSSLESINLPKGITEISVQLFSGCDSLKNIIIPENVTKLGDRAFQATNLASIVIPDGVTELGSWLFNNCPSLKEITIPDSVTTINSNIVRMCDLFDKVYYSGSKQQWNAINIASNEILLGADIEYGKYGITVVPCEYGAVTVDKANVAPGETVKVTYRDNLAVDKIYVNGIAIDGNEFIPTEDSTVTVTLQEGTVATGRDGAATWTIYDDGRMVMEGNGNLSSEIVLPWSKYEQYFDTVIIGEGITQITEYHFWMFDNIKEVTIPSTVTHIGSNAFHSCSNLTKINFTGSRKQWSKVTKQSGWNFQTGDYVMSYGKHDITVGQCENGTVTVDKDIATTGETVTVIVTPAENYEYDKILVNGDEIEGDVFTVTADSIVTATFKPVVTNVEITVNNTASETGATITAPESGWTEGENTFTVSADKPCVVVVSYDGGLTYTRLTATATGTDGTYSFTADINAQAQVAVAVAGDTDGNGKINIIDCVQLKAATLGTMELSPLNKVTCDTDGNGKINIVDCVQLKAATLGTRPLTW